MAVNLGQAVGYLELDTSGFSNALGNARRQLQTFSSQTTSISGKFSAIGSALTGVGSQLTGKLTTPILAAGAAAVKTGSEFNTAMSQVAATMGKPVSAITDLRNIAIKMGNDTAFSAKEAAEGLNYLALAGYDSKQQIAALPKILDLAAAGDMELGKASDMLTDSMSALGLSSKNTKVLMTNMQTTTDQMAKTASKTNTDVAGLGDAILTVGGTAKGLAGFSVDAAHGTAELSAALGILADNGIHASEGGTALRNMIVNLNPTTKPAIKAFKELGVSAYDSQGKMRPLKDTFGDLKTALAGYTQQEQEAYLVQMFGRQNLAAVNAMLGTSSDRWDELTEAILDSEGAAKKMADEQLNNLQGDLKLLSSALGTTSIVINDMVDGPLRNMVQGITNLINKFNEADAGTQQMIAAIVGIAAAIGPVLLIIGQLSSSIGSIIALGGQISGAFSAAASSIAAAFAGEGVAGAAGFLASLGQITIVIAAIIAAVAAFQSAWSQNMNNIQQNTQSIFESIQTIFQGVLGAAQAVVQGIASAWNNDFGGIRTTVESVISTIIAVISTVLQIAVGIAEGIKSAWDSNFLGIQSIAEIFASFIDGKFQKISSVVQIAMEAINVALEGAEAGFEVLKDAAAALQEAWENDFAGIRTIVEGVADAVSAAFDTISQVLKDVTGTIKALINGDWKGAWESAKKTVENLKKNVSTILSGLADTAKKALPKFVEAVKDGFQKAVDNAPKVFKKIVEKTKEILGNLVDKAKEELPKFADKVKEGAEKAKDKFVQFLKDLPGKAGELLGKVVGKAVKFIADFAPKAKEAGSKFLKHLVEEIKGLPGKIGELLGKIVGKAVKFVADFPAKAKEAAKKFVKFLKDNAKDAPHAVSDIAEKIVDAIKDLPETMKGLGKDIIDGLINGVKGMLSSAIGAAKDFADGFIGGFKDALGIHSPSTVAKKEVGENLAKGVIEGVTSQKGNAKKSAEELADAMVGAAKTKLTSYKEIYKMSAADQAAYWKTVIANTKAGTDANIKAQAEYAKAVSNQTKEALKAETDYVKRKTLIWDAYEAKHGKNAEKEAAYWKDVLDHTKKGSDNYLKVLKKYNQAVADQEKERESKEKEYLTRRKKKWDAWEAQHGENAKKEAEFWEKSLSHFKKGSNQYLDAYKKYQEAVGKVQQEEWSKAQERLENRKVYNDVSLKEETKYWNKIRKQFVEGSAERIEADKKYFETKQQLNEQLAQAEQDYADQQKQINQQLASDLAEVQKSYEDAVTSRTNAILSQFKLFDAYKNETAVTGEELKSNLQSQVSALKNWQMQLTQLEGRQILPAGLVDEIREMGVGAEAEIQALNSMSDSELQQYADLWQQKMSLAKNQAETELQGMKVDMEEKQRQIINDAEDKLAELNETYNRQLTKLGVAGKSKSKEAAENVQKGAQEGLASQQQATDAALGVLVQAFADTVKKVKNMGGELKNMASEAASYADSVRRSVEEAKKASGSSGDDAVRSIIKGRHKNGLDYVPYDGYVAELHRGERVLTKNENEQYNNSAGNGISMVNNFYGTKPLDERETARQFKIAQRQIALNWG